jgi:hypothetical protein
MKRARRRLKGGGSQDWLPHRAAELQAIFAAIEEMELV